MSLRDTVFFEKHGIIIEENAIILCDGGAKMVNHLYDEKGNDKKTTVYKDGSGSFKVRGGVLRWTDNNEDAGKDMYFAFSSAKG